MLGLGAFTLVERRRTNPLVDLPLAATPPVLFVNLTSLLLGFGFFLTFLQALTILQAPASSGFGLGLSPLLAGACMIPGGALLALVSGPAAGAVDRFGAPVVLATASVVVASGLAVLVVPEPGVARVVVVFAIVSTGIATAYASTPLLISLHAGLAVGGGMLLLDVIAGAVALACVPLALLTRPQSLSHA